jgi:diguanylate cyclase (GGDEF)-like protein
VFGRLAWQWWREPVDYSGYVHYFATRSLAGAIRLMIGVGIGLISIITLVVLLPAVEHAPPAAGVVVVLFAGLNAVWAVVWCSRPWPTLRQSRVFIVSSDIGIAAVGLAGSTWLTGLFALNCFAFISVYLMFFDGPKALSLHTLLILATTVIFIALAGVDGAVDGGAVAGRILGAVIPVTATPLGIQFGIRTLRKDANSSATDPLTGLLNRRGLHLHFGDLLELGEAVGGEVAVIVVDLDRFKDVNDNYGHAAGDEVLIRCARLIRAAVGSRALIARVGGEEFVIVDLADRHGAEQIAEAIRRAILGSREHPAITASAGVTGVAHSHFVATDTHPLLLLDTVIARADRAMFCAKRNGGNTTHCV